MIQSPSCTVPKEIDFPPYNMKCSGGNVILRRIFHVVSCFPLHFMLYRRNLDCFSNSVNKKYVDNFCEIAKIFTVLAD